MEFWFYAAPGYEARPAAEWEFIGYDPSMDQALEQARLRVFAGDRPFVFRTNDLNSQIAAAKAGVGIAALPCFVALADAGWRHCPSMAACCSRQCTQTGYSDPYAVLNVAELERSLASGDVSITSTSAGGIEATDIGIHAQMSWRAPTTLRLSAQHSVIVQRKVSVSGQGNVEVVFGSKKTDGRLASDRTVASASPSRPAS